MSEFTVNGKRVTAGKNQPLLRFLRDELNITSAKDGCSEGACGACTVLLDGAPIRACTQMTDALAGREILTVEGLSSREQAVYTYAFGAAGAVQCGFCIPGMVLCAKALLADSPDPTEAEIRHAIRNNYCRCTGYTKIIAAIRLAARLLREGGELPARREDWTVGSRVTRLDVPEKVLATGKFTDDLSLEGMCYGSAVRAKYPRARVLSVDGSAARKLPGVVCVLTAEDIPGAVNVGHIEKDQYTLVPVGQITHYLGDAVALVCARDRDTLEKAKKLVRVEYEVLPAVHSVEEAAAEGAPLVFEGAESNVQAHRHISRGNAKKAIAESEYTLSHSFQTPWTEHAFLEPECCVAYPTEEGGVRLLTSDQSAHTTMRECAAMLGIAESLCQVENQLVGGGFGGKEDMSVQHHAALIAYVAKVPVKVKLTRQESILIHPKRHSFQMEFTLGCDRRGIIQGVRAEIVGDTGAFASLGGPVLERACTHASGPYAYENFEVEGTTYYTNNPPAGAFRGFGVTQTCFCIETLLNEMAELLGISPWEIRMRNAITPGGVLPNGQIVGEETGLVETLMAVKPRYDAACAAGKPVGLACAMKNAGVGVGLPDWGRCRLLVRDGKVHIHAGASCIGQGLGTVLVQLAVTATGLSREEIVYERSDTRLAPDSGDTSGSRQTLVTGEACRRACEKLNAARKGRPLMQLEGAEFYGEYLAKTDPLGAELPNPVSHVAYGYATQLCILDPSTERVETIVAAHDVGRAINPLSCEGQIEGGVVMSMGYALRERYPIDENCKPTGKFGTLGLLRAHETPEIQAIVLDKPGCKLAYGAIGIGEITAIPTAPAIAAAYAALHGKRQYALPLKHTPYETPAPEPPVMAVDEERCIGCGLCAAKCPSGAISMVEKRPVTRGDLCLSCGACVTACPKNAVFDPRGIYRIS